MCLRLVLPPLLVQEEGAIKDTSHILTGRSIAFSRLCQSLNPLRKSYLTLFFSRLSLRKSNLTLRKGFEDIYGQREDYGAVSF